MPVPDTRLVILGAAKAEAEYTTLSNERSALRRQAADMLLLARAEKREALRALREAAEAARRGS